MPSGSKKRKAAKKKKVQQTNNNHPNSSLNSHESDGGEVSSPASQDHYNSQHPSAEGEEEDVEKREDSSSVQLLVPEKNSVEGVNHGENTQKVGTEEEGVVQVGGELKSEDFKSKDISMESAKEVQNGGSSGSSSISGSSSSSSSDDESYAVEKKTAVVETGQAVDSVKPVESLLEVITQVNDSVTIGETDNGIVETGPAVDSVKLADSLSEVVNHVNDSIQGEETDNGVVETVTAVDSVKPVHYLSEVLSQVSNSIPVGETDKEVVETASVLECDKVTLIEQVVQVIESSSIDNALASCVVELDLQENGEKKLPMLDDNTGLSPVLMDLGSREKEDEVVSTSEEKAAVCLDAKDSANEVHEDLMLSYNAPNVQTNNREEPVKDYESPVCSINQPLVASAPQMVQKTSLKSCCGMFELFTGSDR